MENITLVNFLKKYSTVNSDFIDDFFNLYDINNPYDFNVDLDILHNWLECKKDGLRQTLFNTYTKNIDYKILKSEKSKSGQKLQKIMLTSDTLKLLCMRSRAKKAEQVRIYYLNLEKLVDKYKNHIISSMNDKIKKLKNNQKPKVNPNKGVIYIIQTSDENGLYKIGRTVNLKKRLNNYNADKADEIVPLFVFETDNVEGVEQCAKGMLKKYQYRKYKEIYETDLDFIKVVIEKCGDYNDELECELVKIKKNKLSLALKNHKGGFNYFLGIYKEPSK